MEWDLHSERRPACWLVLLSDSEETHLFSATCNFKGKDVSAAGKRVKWGHLWNSGRNPLAPLPCLTLFHLHRPLLLKMDAPAKWNLHFLIHWMTRPAPRCPRKLSFISLFLGTPHLTLHVIRQLSPAESPWVWVGHLTEVLYTCRMYFWSVFLIE